MDDPAARWRDLQPSLHVWRRGNALLVGSVQAASAGLPADARGMLIGHQDKWDPWGAQAAIERGFPATVLDRGTALALWAGGEADVPAGGLLVSAAGAPLGVADPAGRRLLLPSRLRRAGLV